MTKTLYVTGKMYEANTVSITDAELVALVSAEQSDDDFWEHLEELHDQLMGDSQVNGFLVKDGFLPKTRDHELEIHFQHPIVGDGIKYKDPKVKTKGYKVIEGSKTTQIRVEKRDGRGK